MANLRIRQRQDRLEPMQKLWYRIFEINGLVVFPVISTFLVYGVGRAIFVADFIYFLVTLGIFLVCITLEMILGITVG